MQSLRELSESSYSAFIRGIALCNNSSAVRWALDDILSPSFRSLPLSEETETTLTLTTVLSSSTHSFPPLIFQFRTF